MRVISDEEAIRQLVARYADAVNRRDADAWRAVWTDDAVWDLGRHHAEGRAAILEQWHHAMDAFDVVLQLVHQGTIDVRGDRATGRWYLHEETVREGARRRLFGTYDDEYVKQPDGWRFASRRYGLLFTDE